MITAIKKASPCETDPKTSMILNLNKKGLGRNMDIKEWVNDAIENQIFFDDNIKNTFEDKGKGQNLFSYQHHVCSRLTTLGGSVQAAFRYLTKACGEIDHTDPARDLIIKALECLQVGMRGE